MMRENSASGFESINATAGCAPSTVKLSRGSGAIEDAQLRRARAVNSPVNNGGPATFRPRLVNASQPKLFEVVGRCLRL
jgi:hypothetical protein